MNNIPSIVPGLLKQKGIVFKDESNVALDFCNDKETVSYKERRLKPFFIIDTFAIKTNSPENIIEINLSDLKRFGYILTSRRSGRNSWMHNQRVMYCLEKISEKKANSKRLLATPQRHLIQRDLNNNKIRLYGSHAGPNHKGGGGPWINIGGDL